MKRTLAVYEASLAFMVAAGQDPLTPVGTFLIRSKSRREVAYEMLHTPDGYAVHQGEGCEGERFNGPIKCWHSTQYSVSGEDIEDMTNSTAVATYEGAQLPARAFTEEDIDVLKKTICRGASDAELGLFVATCKHTGLDPFMKQIHAVFRNTNLGTRENPKWEKVMSIQVGIDGYRLIAERTGKTEGMDGPQWSDNGTEWADYQLSAKPKFARVGVWRKGVSRPFVAVCRWDAYDQNNSMWNKMGAEQLAKCAEALALRRAFPAEMASLPMTPDYIDSDALEIENQGWTPAPSAIEGESRVVQDEEALEPGPAQDNPEQDEDAGVEDGPTTTEEQAFSIADWTDQIKQQPGGEALLKGSVDKARRERWAYAVGEGKRFDSGALTEADASAYIDLLRETYEGSSAAQEPAGAPQQASMVP